jgi:hypothetical protein
MRWSKLPKHPIIALSILKKLRDFLGITPVMGKIVVFRRHSIDERNPMIILNHNADDPG